MLPLAVEVVSPDGFSLESLVRFCQLEEKSGGNAYRDLRHRLCEAIDSQAIKLAAAESPRDMEEIKRQFREDMRDDYDALRESLKLEAKQVVGTKEIVISMILTAVQAAAALRGSVLNTVPGILAGTGAAVAIGGLYSTKSRFAVTRRGVLERHPTAYLYEAKGGLRL
jgi:hypothetical protein